MSSPPVSGLLGGSLPIAPPPSEGLLRMRAMKAEALQCIDTLDARVATALAAREADFSKALRVNAHALQTEIAALRERANDATQAAASSDRVRALEAERNAYRDEALRLDKLLAGGEEELKHARHAAASLREDNAWLRTQLRDARRELALKAAATAGVRPASSEGAG